MDNHTPERVIPRRLPARTEFYERLWQAIELDAMATVDDLRAAGWSEEGIAGAMDNYRAWLEGNVADAVALARIAGGVAA